MKISIIGAGLTGCSLASILKARGHQIFVFEKSNEIGGLCTTENIDGILCDKYGPHIFRTNSDDIYSFVSNHTKLNNKHHYVSTYIHGRLLDWPISTDNINYLTNIFGRYVNDTKAIYDNPSNFEDVSINTFGLFIYRMFVKNYTKNMWHKNPRDISTDFASRVLKINDSDKRYFKTKYQGWPDGGYSKMLNSMLEGCKLIKGITAGVCIDTDITIFTSPIDDWFNSYYGKLDYVGMRFENDLIETKNLWPSNWGYSSVINYPNCDYGFIRQSRYSSITCQLPFGQEIIGYEYPDKNGKTHPVRNKENIDRFKKYAEMSVAYRDQIPAGRQGLFRYMSMDEAIGLSMSMANDIDRWKSMPKHDRYNKILDWSGINERV